MSAMVWSLKTCSSVWMKVSQSTWFRHKTSTSSLASAVATTSVSRSARSGVSPALTFLQAAEEGKKKTRAVPIMSIRPENWLVSTSITGTDEMLFFTNTYAYNPREVSIDNHLIGSSGDKPPKAEKKPLQGRDHKP
jgi:hypothetical protein